VKTLLAAAPAGLTHRAGWRSLEGSWHALASMRAAPEQDPLQTGGALLQRLLLYAPL